MGKTFNALVSVVHSHSHSSTCVFEDFHFFLSSIVSSKDNFESSGFINNKIGSFVLVSVGVSADDDGFFPARDESGDVFDDDGFSEDSSSEDVSDGSIGALPHCFEFELFDSGFVGSDGGALDAYFAFFDGFGGFDGNFVIGGISVFDSEVEVLYLKVKEGENEFVLDGFPDDSGHFVSIKLCNWILNLNLLSLHKRYDISFLIE